ncbi:hypothetical protein [Aeromicrobium massiliense]|uniref:hypothetical protein n=1 Tax=Aeromicrobium massiliense TaxID=1464554 RepID=UPI0002D72193|nr:hypothetical protein [Aeromicrobium massiliense]
MRFITLGRTARLAATALVASTLAVAGTAAPSSAAGKTVTPVAHVFWDATEENGLALKMGNKGRIHGWWVGSECGDGFQGRSAKKFSRSKTTFSKKNSRGRVKVSLRAVEKRLILGEATVTVKGKPECSGTRPMILGDSSSWKSSGAAYAVSELFFYTDGVRRAAEDYRARTGKYPSSKAKLVKAAKRLGVRPSKKFGEKVHSYKSTRKGRSYTLRTSGKRVDVDIEIGPKAGSSRWVY